jgi:hypothetical protein
MAKLTEPLIIVDKSRYAGGAYQSALGNNNAPPAVTYPGMPGYDLATDQPVWRNAADSAWITAAGGGGGTGTVTSVGLTAPAEFSTGAPVTTSGNLSFAWTAQSQSRVLAAPAASSGTPSFRPLVAGDIPSLSGTYLSLAGGTLTGALTLAADPTANLQAATKQYADSHRDPVFGASGASHAAGNVPDPGTTAGTTRYLREDATWVVPPAGGGGIADAPSDATAYIRKDASWQHLIAGDIPALAYVTQVGLVMPAEFTVSNSPITSSGNLTVAKAAQNANLVYAGPTSGSAAPTFRSLVPGDYPTFIASGASHAKGAVPDPGSSSGTTRYLREDATWAAPPGGGGGASLTNRNLFWNGNARIAQVGTSFAGLGPGVNRTLDMWQYNAGVGGTMVATASQVATTDALGFYHRVQFTTAQASLAAGDYAITALLTEGYDWAEYAQQALMLSFNFRASVTGTFSVSLQNAGSDQSWVQSFTYSTANTDQHVSLSVPASPAGGTWNYGNGIGIVFAVVLAAGTTYQTATLGTWQAGNFMAATTQTNGAATLNATFDVRNVQLEVNSTGTASPFEPIAYENQMMRAQRYYYKSFPYAAAPAQNAGRAGELGYCAFFTGAKDYLFCLRFINPMRAIPTVVFFNPQAANNKWRNIALNTDSATAVASNVSERAANAYNPQVTGDAQGHTISVHLTADARF